MYDLWPQLLDMIGAKAAHTTAYHPQANGIVEQLHRQLKASLKAKLNTSNWFNELPLVLLGIGSALKEDIGCSAADMVYGQTLQLPGEFLFPLQILHNHMPFSHVSGVTWPDCIQL